MIINFGSHNETQRLLISAVKERKAKDPYDGSYINKPTIEHIKLQTKHKPGQGKNYIGNLLVTNEHVNRKRGSISFKDWLLADPDRPGYIQAYLDKMRGVTIKGVDYVKAVQGL